MNKYYDQKNNRLVFTGKTATPDYWDNQWDVEGFKKIIESGLKNRLIVNNTKKYVYPNKSKKILEAGCGNGQFVYALDRLGYDAYGVDYAEKTVARTKSLFPGLKITIQDVRKLDFPDNYFDAYWSIGVIEHFFEGYERILGEIHRVLAPGGYLFITFPHMSLLRRLKVKLRVYPPFQDGIIQKEEFYQFALDHDEVIKKFKQNGFVLRQKVPYSGTKGLKDEISIVRKFLQKVYDSKNILLRIFNYGLSVFSARLSSHAILLVFQKEHS